MKNPDPLMTDDEFLNKQLYNAQLDKKDKTIKELLEVISHYAERIAELEDQLNDAKSEAAEAYDS